MFIRKIPSKKNHSSKRYHYTRKKGKWKPKHQFQSQDDAQEFIAHYKMIGYTAYLCPECNHWHIGKKQDTKKPED